MTHVRQLAVAYALARAGFGAGLLGPPSWVAERWIGEDARRPAVQVAMRGLATRDIALALGALDAVRRRGSLRPWLFGAVGCDLADVVASLGAGHSLPARARWGTPVLAGVSAAAGAALAVADDR